MLDFDIIAAQCAPETSIDVLRNIVKVESGFNPLAIGVVGGRLARQPKNKDEAIATANWLHSNGWNFSLGLGQINRYNLSRYGLNYESVFEPCGNLRSASMIFNECLIRAAKTHSEEHARLAAFSCYYSGNFTRGFVADGGDKRSYVQRILQAAAKDGTGFAVSPIQVISDKREQRGSVAKAPDSTRHRDYKMTRNVRELRGD